ncbi:MAG: M20/M25/M40 family metallo-hydrolase [Acidobacteriota bacterium]|nr:M20/M25/M40 family metallo-hydrolase [Acidobacteriota bacterium]
MTDPVAFGATLVSALVVALPFIQSETPSADERALVRFIDTHNDEALALLERVVNINSGTQNFEGVREVGRVFSAELEALGFQTRWIDGAAFKRAGHLVADHPGTGPRILLIGHVDTVFEKDSPFQKFERLDERTARGPGIIDMKGGDVVMLSALKALKATGALDAMNLVVVLTGDEEDSGDPLSAARAALLAAAEGADIAIGFENGPGDPKLGVTASRGTAGWQLTVTGVPAHSSQIFREDIGFGAVYEMARVINAFREQMAGEAHLTFNPGVVLGGTTVEFDAVQMRGTAFGKSNVIAERAVVSGDLRALSAEQFSKARQKMEAIAAASLPHTRATITFEEGYPPMAPTEGNARLLAMYDRASRDLGFGAVAAVNPDRAGAADVSFVAGKIKTIIDGVGLMGRNDHTVRETADLTTLPSQTKRMAVLLHRIQKAGRVE